MKYVLGVDIGSTASKAVLMSENGKIIAKAVVDQGTGMIGPQKVMEEILKSAGITKDEISYILATGYGRFVFEDARNQKSEITCHARGMYYANSDVRTIIDIGGQDIKIISLNDAGRVTDFTMNDKCAAGTGRFLETMARVLGVGTGDLEKLSENAEHVAEISSTCTVFAESEVISKLSAKIPVADLVAGIHQSVARRVAALAFRNGIKEKVAISGGVALNKSVVRFLEEELKTAIYTHEDTQFFGAIGAALYALDERKKGD